MEVGGFGEEFFGGFGKENEADVSHGCDELALLIRDLNELIRFALVTSGVAFEELVGQGELVLAVFAEFADPDISEANGVAVVLQ